MAKKRKDYEDIQSQFVEQRAENRGWEELSVDERQRLSNRFDVLAATVEGRSKIARTLLPGAPQEERRALKQKIRTNLPQKTGSVGQSNVETPQASTLNTNIPAPWNAPNLNYRASAYIPPARPTTTTSTSAANASRGQSGFRKALSGEWMQDVPGLGQVLRFSERVMNPLTPEEELPSRRQRASSFGEAARETFTFDNLKREFGEAFITVGPVAAAGTKTIGSIVRRVVPGAKSAGKGLTRLMSPAAARGTQEAVQAATNETRAVASSVERTVAGSPAERLPTTGPATSKPKIAGQPKSRTATRAKAPASNTVKVSEPAAATSSPVKQVEVVPQNPVKVAGSEPPTVLQKTATPEGIVAPTSGTTQDDLARQIFRNRENQLNLEATTRQAKKAEAKAGPKKVKESKPKKAKKSEDVKVEFEDKTNVAAATGKPASGEVVGGATPKGPSQEQLSTQTNLPPSMESSRTSPIPAEQKPQPVTGPSVSEPAKRSRKSKSSSTEPKFKATKAQLEEAQKNKTSAQHLKLLREAPVEKVEIVTRIDSATGQSVPVINPQTGTPWVKTTYVSQAKQMAQEQAERAAKRAAIDRPGDGVRIEFDDGKGKVLGPFAPDNVDRRVKIEFDVEGAPATPEAKARMEEIRRESTVNMVPVKGGDPEYAQTFAGQTRKQRDIMEAAEGRLMSGADLPENRRRVGTRKKRPKIKEGLTAIEETGIIPPKRFDPKTGRHSADNRSIEEIRASAEEYRKMVDAARNRPAPKPRTNKEAKRAAEWQQLNKESAARMKSPEAQAEAKVEEVRRRVTSQRAQRAQEIAEGERRLGKTGMGVKGRYGEVRAKLRREQRQARVRKYPKEVNQSLHAFMLNEPAAPIGKNRTLYDDMIDIIDAGPSPRSRGAIDQPSVPATPVTPPKPEGIQYFEMNPAKMDYEQLLRVEQAGFKLQVTRGAPTRFTRDRGVRGTFSKAGEGLSKEEFSGLMKSTEYTRDDLLRLIKSTSGGK